MLERAVREEHRHRCADRGAVDEVDHGLDDEQHADGAGDLHGEAALAQSSGRAARARGR